MLLSSMLPLFGLLNSVLSVSFWPKATIRPVSRNAARHRCKPYAASLNAATFGLASLMLLLVSMLQSLLKSQLDVYTAVYIATNP